jgi:hypothetical protein
MSLSIQQFAFNVGTTARKVREAADPFHTAYAGGTPTQQADLRKRWMLGHLEGQGFTSAERILSEGKGAGAKPAHIKAIDRASSDFRYMVVRPVKAAPVQAKSMRLSKELRSSAMDFLANFEGESLEDQLKQALAVLRAL